MTSIKAFHMQNYYLLLSCVFSKNFFPFLLLKRHIQGTHVSSSRIYIFLSGRFMSRKMSKLFLRVVDKFTFVLV